MLFSKSSSDNVKVVSLSNKPAVVPVRRILFLLGELILSALVGYLIYTKPEGLMPYGLLIIGAVFFLSWYNIGAFVFSFWAILLRALLAGTIIALPFMGRLPLPELLVVWFVLAAVLSGGAWRAKGQADNSIRFSALGGLSGSRSASLFLLSLVIALCWGAPFLSLGGASFSRDLVNWLLPPSEKIMQQLYPGFSFEMTIGELFTLLLQKQTQPSAESLIPQGFDLKLLPSGLNLGQDLSAYASQFLAGAEQETQKAFIKKLSETTGLTVKSNQKVGDLLSAYLEKVYQGYPASVRNLVGKGIFLLVFISIWSVVNIVGFLLSFIELMVFSLLRAVRLIRISKITVEKEVLSL